MIESFSLSREREIRQVSRQVMARVEVSRIISQWLHHLETDPRIMDKMETTLSSLYEVKGPCVEEEARCCVPCQCEECSERSEREDSQTSVLTEYRYRCGCVEEVYTFRARRVGRSRRRRCDGSVDRTDWRQGVRQGFSLVLSGEGKVESVGWWRAGQRAGTWWRAVRGGAWLVTNTSTSLAIFIYPDLTTALLGTISTEDGRAEEELGVCEVRTVSLTAGVLVPGLRRCEESLPVTRGLTKTVLHYPHVRDPYESKVVEVRQSLIPSAGEGLFIKSEAGVEAGVVVSYFAGVEVPAGEIGDSEYSISWLGGARLDIPPDMRESYCSTLGHKACHSFSPNCEYSWAVHPRFGKIRSIVSLRRLEQGEEVLTDYKYSYSKAPQWYRDDLTNFLINNFNMETGDIAEYINRMEKDRKCV